ncbi:hypothetical protein BCV70DRAFT_236782, partial [Testicularia cyperi]
QSLQSHSDACLHCPCSSRLVSSRHGCQLRLPCSFLFVFFICFVSLSLSLSL